MKRKKVPLLKEGDVDGTCKGPFTLSVSVNADAPDQSEDATHFEVTRLVY